MGRQLAAVMVTFTVTATTLALPSAALAGPDCTCRFGGRDLPEGAVVCIDLASGTYTARCERVLNNTAWRRLSEGCALG